MAAEAGCAPIFICGPPRSGTTLLARLLGRHSQVAIANEFDFFGGLHAACEGAGRLQLLDAWYSRPSAKMQNLDRAGLLARLEALPEEPRSLLLAALEQYAQQQCKARPGEKSPIALPHVETLLRWFPDAQVLVTVRDGRDTAASLRHLPMARAGLMACALNYRDSARHILALGAGRRFEGPRLRLVRYEDLLERPEACLAEIDAWLGLELEPAQFEADAAGAFAKQDLAWMALASQKVDATRGSSWRGTMSDMDCWRINAVIGPELRALGYGDETLDGCPLWRRALIHTEKGAMLLSSWGPLRWGLDWLGMGLLALGFKKKTVKAWGF